jgi:hypothetical protein
MNCLEINSSMSASFRNEELGQFTTAETSKKEPLQNTNISSIYNSNNQKETRIYSRKHMLHSAGNAPVFTGGPS